MNTREVPTHHDTIRPEPPFHKAPKSRNNTPRSARSSPFQKILERPLTCRNTVIHRPNHPVPSKTPGTSHTPPGVPTRKGPLTCAFTRAQAFHPFPYYVGRGGYPTAHPSPRPVGPPETDPQ
jgi:hypothetical protein